MAHTALHSQAKKAKTTNPNKQLSSLNNNIFTMLAAFTGVVFGVLGSLGFVTSYIHSQLAGQTASLSHQIVQMRAADVVSANQCTAPAGSTSNSSGVKTAAAVTGGGSSNSTPVGSGGGGKGTQNGPFVSKLVSGVFAHDTATISDTGQKSNNQITFNNTNTTTVTNKNDVHVDNVNLQGASSGDASSSKNTNAGTTSTGDASNANKTSTTVNINN